MQKRGSDGIQVIAYYGEGGAGQYRIRVTFAFPYGEGYLSECRFFLDLGFYGFDVLILDERQQKSADYYVTGYHHARIVDCKGNVVKVFVPDGQGLRFSFFDCVEEVFDVIDAASLKQAYG